MLPSLPMVCMPCLGAGALDCSKLFPRYKLLMFSVAKLAFEEALLSLDELVLFFVSPFELIPDTVDMTATRKH